MDGRFPREATPGAAGLVLEGEPVTFAPSSLPGHRMLTLSVRNIGTTTVSVRAGDLSLFDDGGESLQASSAFGRARAATVGSAAIGPGEELAVDLVWRARVGAGIPARVEIAGAVIELADPAPAAAPTCASTMD